MTEAAVLQRIKAKGFSTLFIWVWGIASLYPILWITLQSLRPDLSFFTNPWSLPAPGEISLDPYATAFEVAKMGQYYGNSLLVTAVTVTFVLVASTTAGYAMSRMTFPGHRVFGGLLLLIMAIPGAVLLLPMFLVSNELNLLNTRIGLVLPYTTFTLPLAIYLMKNNFDALPSEVLEAASVDGCTERQRFWHVVLPLVPGAIATVGFLTFMPVWDEYIWALLTLQDPGLYTLPVGLVALDQNKFQYGFNVSFAAMVVTALPVVLALVVSQRGFINSVTAGAVKG